MSINELYGKIKGIVALLDKRDYFAVTLIVLTGFICFFCGMLYQKERSRPPVVITGGEPVFSREGVATTSKFLLLDNSSTTVRVSGAYVGSKSSHKFHLPWCPGALKISDANKIWFDSKEEALAKGYTPASNCKGI